MLYLAASLKRFPALTRETSKLPHVAAAMALRPALDAAAEPELQAAPDEVLQVCGQLRCLPLTAPDPVYSCP